LGIARFAAQKRPPATQPPDVATEELRELARLRERLQEDFASRLRQLHRAVDLGFPEFTDYVRTLESQLAATILSRYPTAGAIASYVGVIPRIRQSGKKRFTKGPANPLGNARLRKSLYMVVLQMVRRNPWLRQHYERLRAAGEPGKVAIIAAMRKLLAAVWSVATHRRPFVPIMPA
jgi:transposase